VPGWMDTCEMDSIRQSGGSAPEVRPAARRGALGEILALLLILGVIFAWRIFFSAHVNLLPDECSYWTWSRRLDWSYFDNSGMVAYLIRLSTTLWGEQTPLSVRMPFLILSGLTTYLIFRTSVLLFGDRTRGLLVAVLFNLAPMSLLGGSAAVHDNALLFFWSFTLWSAARFVVAERPFWFYVMGVSSGLAILSKYTGVLAPVCLLVFLVWLKPYRSWLLRKEPWIGAGIAAVFTLPIVWWNMDHGWASLYHVFFIGSGYMTMGQRFLDGLGYHLAQLLLVSPLLYWALVSAMGAAGLRNIFRPTAPQALLLSFSLPLLLFGVQAFRGHVEANWAVMGYVSAAILAVEFIPIRQGAVRPGMCARFDARFLRWAVAAAVALSAGIVAHAWIGLVPAAVERKIAKEDRIVWETAGWEGLGKHVADLKQPEDVLAADSYQLCALLEFNVPGNPNVRYLAPWRRPTQFDVWEPSFDNLKDRTILFVSPNSLEPSSASHGSIYENFRDVRPLPSYHVQYHGEPIREIHLYRCERFDPFRPRRLGPRSLRYQE
jgi:4-amino-4-deoxy-L-arabinose transferase-like glycosyltransferase